MSDSDGTQPLPGYSIFRLEALKVLNDVNGEGRCHFLGVCGRVADRMDLSEAQRNRRLSRGKSMLGDRVYCALYRLRKAGLVELLEQRIYQITKEGKQILPKLDPNLDRISDKQLRNLCPKYAEWDQREKSHAGRIALPVGSGEDSDDLLSPVERLEIVCEELRLRAEEELLERLRAVKPASFEKIVTDLLQAMDYGKGNADWAEVTSGPGDGGIGGVIREDALDLSKIYIQAKRYGEGNTVGPDRLQQFVGVLGDKGVAKGVFVTTSSFTEGAKKFAKGNNNIAWVDGEEFVRLMIQHGVGVVYRNIPSVEKFDENYFSEEYL